MLIKVDGVLEKYFDKDLIELDELIGLVEELDAENDELKEEIEDIKENIDENYKQIPVEEQIELFEIMRG